VHAASGNQPLIAPMTFRAGVAGEDRVDPVELSYSMAGRNRDMPDFSITPAVVKRIADIGGATPGTP
jgi:hypothetical protein